MKTKQLEYKLIYIALIGLFVYFMIVPIGSLLMKSFTQEGAFSLAHYGEVFATSGFSNAIFNSLKVCITSSLITVFLAFLLAYAKHYTNLPKIMKQAIHLVAILPMLLPTITYGFALIYSFGKQGLITNIFGTQLFDIYGFTGLSIGYVIYTLPIAYMLINNAMKYIDKKFIIVSKLMKDSKWQTFKMTLLRPLIGTFAAALIQCFFLSFTDFGIPASVGGQYQVVSSLLYTYMLGSIPNFAKGAVIAMVMLIPSIISISLLHYLEKYNVRYNKVSAIELKKSKGRDISFAMVSTIICIIILAIFAIIFIMPFVEQWPYKMSFTFDHVKAVFSDGNLLNVYKNSLFVAVVSALVGTLVAYGAALITTRSKLNRPMKKGIDSIALLSNTIPGMVIGIAYLFMFSGTSLQNTFLVIIVSNIVHFFSTPYLMMQGTLNKMNASFETTAKLMKDSWFQTIKRVITPNAMASLLEVFAYYFVNAMVTISAIIFIAGTKTMVITTKIKELQYFAKFNEIFVLSMLILFTNIAAKALFNYLIEKRKKTVR